MTDNMTASQRSKTMSRIKSKWTKQEKLVHNYLKGNKIKHLMHPKILGNPDILINGNIAVFLHGCFWHKCKMHYKSVKSNKAYWNSKLEKNVIHDKKNRKLLKQQGHKVLIYWEHDIKHNFERTIKRLVKYARKNSNTKTPRGRIRSHSSSIR